MSIHDPIADMLCVVRNGVRSKKKTVNVKKSKLTLRLLDILKKERYIFDYKAIETNAQGEVKVYLEAPEGDVTARLRKIRNITKVSRPGLRIYRSTQDIPNVLSGIGMCVISTSKGVMTGAEAKKKKIGGEVLVKVW